MATSVELIASEITKYDRNHTLRLARRTTQHKSIFEEIDFFVAELSGLGDIRFNGIGHAWQEVGGDVARSILRRILEYDLAYGTREIEGDDAVRISNAYLELFTLQARYFTNGRFDCEGSGWSGASRVAHATCETGVVVVDSTYIGILWCHDED